MKSGASISIESAFHRRRRVLMPGVGNFYGDHPLELVRGVATKVWDADGNEYLDFFCGVGVTSLGHCHPRVVSAAARQLETLQHVTTLYVTAPMVRVAEKLLSHAPANLSRVFFCADGSGAMDGALVAARRATGRPHFIAFDLGLHGRTSLTMDATGLPFWKCDPFPPSAVHHVSAPVHETLPEALAAFDKCFDQLDRSSIAAMIAEPILGNGGIVVPPPGYFRAVVERLRRHGILLIADEVQTGFCRTGRWFAMEHWDVEPDLMCVSKALANGLPAAAWLCSEQVAQSMNTPLASTYGGNLVCMAAAEAALGVMEDEDLATRAEVLGTQFIEALAQVARETGVIGQPRGLGLMIGADVIGGPRATDELLLSLRHKGVLAGKAGRNRDVLVFEPPLTITAEEIGIVVDALDESCRSLCV